MAEQPVNLSTVLYLGVCSRAEQRVLQAIFKAIVERGRCVAILAILARDSNTSKSTTRNTIAIDLFERPSAALTGLSRFPTL